MAEEYCAHPECDCEVEPDKAISKGDEYYCSEHCANGETSAAEDCECGHPDCG